MIMERLILLREPYFTNLMNEIAGILQMEVQTLFALRFANRSSQEDVWVIRESVKCFGIIWLLCFETQ